MKVKEAIEYLEGQKNSKDKYEPIPPNRLGIDYVIDDIIALLKRGEKFEKMWGEVVRYFGYMEWKDEIIEKIKQKYFPK